MKKLISLASLIVLATVLSNISFAKEYSRKANEKAIEKQLEKMDKLIEKGPYKKEWDSLKAHNEAPEWFRDAKLGIYFHWGVYSVPAYGNEWYPRNMHLLKDKKSVYKHHAETWGEPNVFGYHDFIPMFKAEHFDADNWVTLFKKAGAKFVGPVAEHHDGYSMWDSELTPWNSKDTGPHHDIVGEMEKAVRKQNLKFITTFHHERSRTWYPRVEGWPTTSNDPKLQMLYLNVSEDFFNQIFQAKLGEAIDKYKPDLIWFDGQMQQIQDTSHLRFLAYYFNNAKKWGRDVVVTTKKNQYPAEVSVMDFEKGRMDKLTDYCWLTDDTISMGSWCYTDGLEIKPAWRVLHDFIDIVSKNGCLLLNVSPMANGIIPDNQRSVLLELGQWLDLNGQAIYETRPWLEFGQGPVKMRKSGSFVGHDIKYSWRDIRYTRSKDNKTLYAIVLGWPENPKLNLSIIKVDSANDAKVTLIGYDKPIELKVNDKKQPVISVPQLSEDQRPCEYAYVFKLEGLETSLQPKK